MYNIYFKRFFDIVFSIIAMLLLSPLLIPVIFILLLTGEHYVFYSQKRVGFKNSRFKIHKFATMLKNSPNMGTGSITLRKDPRVLPFGSFLRKTKINELPQIFNVFLGDMSLIGPRPQMEVDFFRFEKKYQDKIYNAKPGITGIGSVVFRDEEKLVSESTLPPAEFFAKHIDPYKCELELWYQNNLNFITDFKIMFLTAWVIIFSSSNLPEKMFKNLPKKIMID